MAGGADIAMVLIQLSVKRGLYRDFLQYRTEITQVFFCFDAFCSPLSKGLKFLLFILLISLFGLMISRYTN
jgi:hypothetical protein